MSKLDIIKALLKKRNIKEGKGDVLKAAPIPKGISKGVDDALEKAIKNPIDDLFRSIGINPPKASQAELDAAAQWLKQNEKALNPEQLAHYKFNLGRQSISDDMRKLFAPQVKPSPAKPAPDQRPFKEPVKPEVKPFVEPKTYPLVVPKTDPLVKPEVKPETKPLVKPEVKPETKPLVKPEVKPETKPLVVPKTNPLVKPEVVPQTKTLPVPQTKIVVVPQTSTKVVTQTKTDIKPPAPPKTPTGTKPPPVVPPKIPFGFGGRARGRDLRTNITGTGVREEYISEEERFKKFKVMYIINGSEKTNVYRYKGKDTFAKARVMRQLRERGAGSIRFMQYESVDIEEGATWSPGVGWIGGASDEGVDERGDGYRVNPKTGENERVYPNKQYGYGYKDNGRRKALPRSTEKIYHAVSFQQKDAAKEEGMRWDPDVKKWYHSSPERSANSKFKKLDEAYMPDATRKPVVYRAPPKRGEVVGKMKVRLIRRHQDVMPGERTATSDNTKRLRKLIRKVLKKGKLKR